MSQNLRQVIYDHMAQIAAQHAAALYPHLDGDTAAQLFALLTDTALACQLQAEAELADPGPGQSLAAASGLSAKQALLTGLGENLTLKAENPGMTPVNGWLAWRAANGEDEPPAMTSQPGYQRGDRIALVATDDPGTRLRPGDQGTVTRWDPAQGPARRQVGLRQHPEHAPSRRRPGPPAGPRRRRRRHQARGPRRRRARPGFPAGHHRPGHRPEQAAVRALPDPSFEPSFEEFRPF